MKNFINLFSYIFHPIFVPVYGTLIFFYLIDNQFNNYQQFLIVTQVSIISIFIPITFFYILRIMGKIDSVMASKISERKIPLIIQVILIYILFSKSITKELIPQLHFFLIGGMFSALLALVFLYLNLKASLHMVGMSSLLIFIVGISIFDQSNKLGFIAIVLVLNGCVASSRLSMNAHTNKELFLGFVVGFFPQIIIWKFWS